MATQSRAERSLLTSLCNVSLFTLILWHLLWYSTSSLALFWHVFVSRWCGLCKVGRASTDNIIEEHTHFNRSVLCLYLNLSRIIVSAAFVFSFIRPAHSFLVCSSSCRACAVWPCLCIQMTTQWGSSRRTEEWPTAINTYKQPGVWR